MKDVLKLQSTLDDFHGLSADWDKARKGSTRVRVSRLALGRLIRDHSATLRKLRDMGIQTEDAV